MQPLPSSEAGPDESRRPASAKFISTAGP